MTEGAGDDGSISGRGEDTGTEAENRRGRRSDEGGDDSRGKGQEGDGGRQIGATKMRKRKKERS